MYRLSFARKQKAQHRSWWGDLGAGIFRTVQMKLRRLNSCTRVRQKARRIVYYTSARSLAPDRSPRPNLHFAGRRNFIKILRLLTLKLNVSQRYKCDIAILWKKLNRMNTNFNSFQKFLLWVVRRRVSRLLNPIKLPPPSPLEIKI